MRIILAFTYNNLLLLTFAALVILPTILIFLIMGKKILTAKDLYAGGKMIAFIKGNRSVNPKNISKKKESLEKFGMNLVPLMYVEGQKAVNDGCTLVHPITKEDIPDEEASKYVAIVEGQHRYTAAKETDLNEEMLFLYECYSDKDTNEILAETNTVTDPWSGADYANGAALFNPQNELAKFTKELADLGYPTTTIGYIACFAPGKLGKTAYSKLIAGKEIKTDYNLERAKYFLDAARTKFKDTFIAKRYLITVVADLSTEHGYKRVCDALKQMPDAIVKRVQEAKSEEKQGILKMTLENLLNK